MRPFLPVIGIIAALLAFSAPAAAADFILAKIGNIPGGSTREGYAGWTTIESYSLAPAAASPRETATGSERSKLMMQRLLIRKHPGSVTMTKLADVGSSRLRAAAGNGQVFPSVELKIFKVQGDPGLRLLQSYSFLNAKISSYSTSGSADGTTESITLDFEDMRQVQAPPQSATGQ